VNPVSYEVALPVSLKRVHSVFHVSRLKRARADQPEFSGRPPARRPKPAVTDFNQNELFNVERILDVRIGEYEEKKKKMQRLEFEVRWEDPYQDPKWDSWEPYTALKHNIRLPPFLASPRYIAFTATSAFRAFKLKYPKRVP
jgi:hypothetical protein